MLHQTVVTTILTETFIGSNTILVMFFALWFLVVQRQAVLQEFIIRLNRRERAISKAVRTLLRRPAPSLEDPWEFEDANDARRRNEKSPSTLEPVIAEENEVNPLSSYGLVRSPSPSIQEVNVREVEKSDV